MKKVHILLRRDNSIQWPSFVNYGKILHDHYQGLNPGKFRTVVVPRGFALDTPEIVAKTLGKSEVVGSIVVTDPLVSAAQILSVLKRFRVEELTLHLYGNLFAQQADYRKISKKMDGKVMRIVVASSRMRELAYRVFGPTAPVVICGVPVVKKVRLNLADGKQFRSTNGITKNDIVMGYAGRLTQGKNLPRLFELFQNASRLDPSMKLLIAGDYDELGNNPRNIFASHDNRLEIARALRKIQKGLRSRIYFLGDLTPKEILGFYSGIDVFVSLSSFWGEDFGLSPAEALKCGVPCLLTDWGGYADLLNEPRAGIFTNVRGWQAPEVGPVTAESMIQLLRKDSIPERRRRARNYYGKFRLETSLNLLTNLFKSKPIHRYQRTKPLLKNDLFRVMSGSNK